MFSTQLFLPVLAQVAITTALGVATGVMRVRAVRRRDLQGDVSLGQRNWPQRTQQISNAFNNQWETPTLFYAGVAFAMIAGRSGPMLVGLAWAYVATRVIHALIYTTSNVVQLRFFAFAAGFVAVLVFWGTLARQVLG
jgi:hypothetical protein